MKNAYLEVDMLLEELFGCENSQANKEETRVVANIRDLEYSELVKLSELSGRKLSYLKYDWELSKNGIEGVSRAELPLSYNVRKNVSGTHSLTLDNEKVFVFKLSDILA